MGGYAFCLGNCSTNNIINTFNNDPTGVSFAICIGMLVLAIFILYQILKDDKKIEKIVNK